MCPASTEKASFDSCAKKSAATNLISNILYEMLMCSLSEYCHIAFLESTLNFEHLKKNEQMHKRSCFLKPF